LITLYAVDWDSVQACPAKTLSILNGKAEVAGDRSLNCRHCQPICPEGAVTVEAIDDSAC